MSCSVMFKTQRNLGMGAIFHRIIYTFSDAPLQPTTQKPGISGPALSADVVMDRMDKRQDVLGTVKLTMPRRKCWQLQL
jgi:hypothetical protein